MLTVLVFIIILGLLIFIHEAGHFVAARLAGIKVEEFAFGFPPRILSWKRRGTTYALNLLPIGGYVRLLGEDGGSDDPRSFGRQKARVRLAVIVAGVFMNFVLAILILWLGFLIGMTPLVSKPADLGGSQTSELILGAVVDGSAADQAGLKQGDIVLNFDSPEALKAFTISHVGETVELQIQRQGKTEPKSIPLGTDPEAPLGVFPVQVTKVKLALWPALQAALIETGKVTAATFIVLGQVFTELFSTGKLNEAVSGPVGIFNFTGQAVALGFTYVLQLLAMLSINLGLLNILPIPALDGGRALFVFLEGVVRRKVVRQEIETAIHALGFFFLIALIILITYRDLTRLG